MPSINLQTSTTQQSSLFNQITVVPDLTISNPDLYRFRNSNQPDPGECVLRSQNTTPDKTNGVIC